MFGSWQPDNSKDIRKLLRLTTREAMSKADAVFSLDFELGHGSFSDRRQETTSNKRRTFDSPFKIRAFPRRSHNHKSHSRKERVLHAALMGQQMEYTHLVRIKLLLLSVSCGNLNKCAISSSPSAISMCI